MQPSLPTDPAPTGPAPTGPAPTGPAASDSAPTGTTPTSPPSARGWNLKWYYFVIAGIIAFCLVCSCGVGIYLIFGGDRPSVGLGSDPTAGCEEAIHGAPADDTDGPDASADGHEWAAHLRKAAEKANRPEIRTAILEDAAAHDKYADLKEEIEAKKQAGTVDLDDTHALSEGLHERLKTTKRLYDVCIKAGYK